MPEHYCFEVSIKNSSSLKSSQRASRTSAIKARSYTAISRFWRNGYMQSHADTEFAKRTYLSIVARCDGGNDHAQLRNDPLFQLLAAEPEKQLASPPTISLFETRITRPELLKMQIVFIEHFFNSHKEPPDETIPVLIKSFCF